MNQNYFLARNHLQTAVQINQLDRRLLELIDELTRQDDVIFQLVENYNRSFREMTAPAAAGVNLN